MKISNSYIFMSNTHRENNNYKKENDTIIISTTNVLNHIEKAFNMRKNRDNEFEVFKNNYSFNYKFDDIDYDVAVVIHIVGNNTYVTVSVNSSNKEDEGE